MTDEAKQTPCPQCGFVRECAPYCSERRAAVPLETVPFTPENLDRADEDVVDDDDCSDLLNGPTFERGDLEIEMKPPAGYARVSFKREGPPSAPLTDPPETLDGFVTVAGQQVPVTLTRDPETGEYTNTEEIKVIGDGSAMEHVEIVARPFKVRAHFSDT